MRILVLSNLYPPVEVGGYEQRCAETVRALMREHDVLVLTSRRQRRLLGRETDVQRQLQLLPDDWRGTLRAPLASLHATYVMRRLLRRLRPDLVFVWNASRIPRAAVWAASELGYPVAFSVADPWFGAFVEGDQFLRYLVGGHRGVHRAWAQLARLANRLPALRLDLSTVHAVSIAWNSHALRRLTPIPRGYRAVLERVIYPAVSREELFAGVERSLSPSPTIVYIGRLEPQKAPDVAVRSLALLRERHGIDCRLVIVGSGERATAAELKRLVAELGLEGRVELRGRLAPPAVVQVLAGAHAVVVPSRWQEPFGLVCLEAALARVPVVASLSGGMPEMLESESEALFFAIDDVEGCAAALARTLSEQDLTRERVLAAFGRAKTYSKQRYEAEQQAFVIDAASAGHSAAS